jgi:probable selenium-dependent hydroxylase accessory protein YqeC
LTPLLHALAIGRGDVVALVGAGGKTTLLYRLAEEARRAGLRVLATATTHTGALPEAVTGPVFMEADGDPLPGLEQALLRHGQATLLSRRVREDKLQGVARERVDALAALADLVLVEADGARGRSLKLPAAHEPVVPRCTTLLLVLAALDLLGEPLDERRVHRVELVGEACGKARGERLAAEDVRRCLCAPDGYPARVPPRARATVFLNKVHDAPSWESASRLAPGLVPPYAMVVAGSARAGECRVLAVLPSA